MSRRAFVVFSFLLFGSACGAPRIQVVRPIWVEKMPPFERTIVVRDLGFAVDLPNDQWMSRRIYHDSLMFSFELTNFRRQATIGLRDVKTGTKDRPVGDAKTEAERLRAVYADAGVKSGEVAVSPDGRTATFSYRMSSWLTVTCKQVVVIALSDHRLLVLRGEWPPEAEADMVKDLKVIVDSVRVAEP